MALMQHLNSRCFYSLSGNIVHHTFRLCSVVFKKKSQRFAFSCRLFISHPVCNGFYATIKLMLPLSASWNIIPTCAAVFFFEKNTHIGVVGFFFFFLVVLWGQRYFVKCCCVDWMKEGRSAPIWIFYIYLYKKPKSGMHINTLGFMLKMKSHALWGSMRMKLRMFIFRVKHCATAEDIMFLDSHFCGSVKSRLCAATTPSGVLLVLFSLHRSTHTQTHTRVDTAEWSVAISFWSAPS